MDTYDHRVDAYIEKAQPFAQPILHRLREIVHKACPEVVETIKWGMPFFDYKGMLCQMASFKQHAVFGFWKGALLNNEAGMLSFGEGDNIGMGHLGKIKSMEDIPDEKLMIRYIKNAMQLNDDGIKVAKNKPKSEAAKAIPDAPDYLLAALNADEIFKTQWDAFTPSQRKEYIQWIAEARTEPTRQNRLATTLEWVKEGKRMNWKYEKK